MPHCPLSKEATDGAHVAIYGMADEFIFPMCNKCNNKGPEERLTANSRTIAVPVNAWDNRWYGSNCHLQIRNHSILHTKEIYLQTCPKFKLILFPAPSNETMKSDKCCFCQNTKTAYDWSEIFPISWEM